MITTDPKKLQSVQRYFIVWSVLLLLGTTAYLFTAIRSLEIEFRGYVQNDQREMVKQIERNTEALQRVAEDHKQFFSLYKYKQ
jgi:hypothetical protein